MATDHDLDLLRRLQAGFQAAEPNQATKYRILHKLTAGTGETRRARGARPARTAPARRGGATAGRSSWQRRTLRLVPLVAGLAVAILAAALLYDAAGSPDAALITKRALAAVNQPGAVTYYKMTASIVDKRDPGAVGKCEAEYWLDNENHAYRYRIRNLPQQPGGPIYGLTKGGTQPAINIFAPVGDSGGDAFNQWFGQPTNTWGSPSGTADRYQKLLSSGTAKLLGKETIENVETYKLEIATSAVTAKGTEWEVTTTATYTINVRTSDYTPVRVVEDRVAHIDGGNDLHTTQTIDLTDTKTVDAASLGSDFFQLRAPAQDEHVEGTLTLDQLRSFSDFDLYWLGDSFAGLKPVQALYSRENMGFAKSWPDYRMQIRYAGVPATGTGGGNTDSQVTLTMSPRMADDLLPQLVLAESTRTSIGGTTAYVAEGGDGTLRIAMSIGSTTILLGSTDKATVLKAAAELVKLN